MSVSSQRHVAVFLDKSNSYGRQLLEGIAEYLAGQEAWSLFIETRSTKGVDRAWLAQWKGDGVIGMIRDRSVAARLRQMKLPTVETHAYVEGLRLPCVATDHQAIGRMAAEHLLERQFRWFAYSGYEAEPWSDKRGNGFAQVVSKAGFSCETYAYPRHHRRLAAWEKAQERLAAWIAELHKPVAIMACSDRHAQRILDACRRAAVAVPEHVAVVGVDNDEEICRLSNPPLSSVMDQPKRIGFEAARLLDALMTRKQKGVPAPLLLPPLRVVTRRSSDITAIDDERVAEAVRFIREHACEGITVDQVIKNSPLSRTAFYQEFEKAMGRSPHAEILRIQLDRVKQLLRQTNWALPKIAEIAGFHHHEYLSVAFKREVGVTPGAYRVARRR